MDANKSAELTASREVYECHRCRQQKPRDEIAGFYGSRCTPVCKACLKRPSNAQPVTDQTHLT
jgi:hypothetical protein